MLQALPKTVLAALSLQRPPVGTDRDGTGVVAKAQHALLKWMHFKKKGPTYDKKLALYNVDFQPEDKRAFTYRDLIDALKPFANMRIFNNYAAFLKTKAPVESLFAAPLNGMSQESALDFVKYRCPEAMSAFAQQAGLWESRRLDFVKAYKKRMLTDRVNRLLIARGEALREWEQKQQAKRMDALQLKVIEFLQSVPPVTGIPNQMPLFLHKAIVTDDDKIRLELL